MTVTLTRVQRLPFPQDHRFIFTVQVDGRRYLTVRCTQDQASRMVRSLRSDKALPAIDSALRRAQP